MIYCLELYDKDNDVADIIAYSSDPNKLRQYGLLVEYLVKQDKVIRHCSDGTKEPYDTITVRPLEPQEEHDKSKPYF